MIRRRRQDGVEAALTNFSLTFAKALLVFCMVLFLMVNPQQGKDGVKPKAEYLITIDWLGTMRYDVDLWVRQPNGSTVYFQNREAGVVFLERDDLGQDCAATTNGAKSVNTCEEIVVLRGVVPGEYIVSLHLYSANGTTSRASVTPVMVQAKIERLNPTVMIVWQSHVELTETRQEKGLLRFTEQPDGSIGDLDTEEIPPVVYANRTTSE